MAFRTLQSEIRKQRFKPVVEWEYDPTERQIAFHRNPATYKLYGGAVGGGKSMALCAEAVKLSMKYPGNRGYFCRHEFASFKRSTLVTFERICPREVLKGHYRDDKIFAFRNGSEIVYGGLGGEEDLEKIKSTEFGWFAIDEASETFEEMFLMLIGRLRWVLPDGSRPKYKGLLASNPEPGWVKDRFVDQKRPDYAFIPALPKDNPHLPHDYDSRLRKDYPEEWIKRYLDGSWDVFEGQIYKEFTRDRHVYRGFEMGSWWTRFRVIDHGYTNPTACLWAAIDQDGRIWIYDEHYERGMTIVEHARIIKAKHPDFKGLTLCDPSMFSSTMQKGGKPWSPADEYRDNGIVCLKPYGDDGKVTEAVGINLVKQRLKAIGGEEKLPMLMVHEDCVNTVREILKYRWKNLKVSDRGAKNAPEEPVDFDNHALDAIRYLCVYRPLGSEKASVPLDPNSIRAAFNKLRRQSKLPFYAGWN